MTKEEIGRILKECRVRAGLTQPDVSRKIGKKQQTISCWEKGIGQPDANMLFELCDLYGVTVDEAFGLVSHSGTYRVSAIEYEIIKKYRELDAERQGSILNALQYEYDCVTGEGQSNSGADTTA